MLNLDTDNTKGVKDNFCKSIVFAGVVKISGRRVKADGMDLSDISRGFRSDMAAGIKIFLQSLYVDWNDACSCRKLLSFDKGI